jgi:bifunctional non-homologous end joining protein LigD
MPPTKLIRRGLGASRLPKSSFAPLPDFVQPMKAQLVDSKPPGDWIYEIRFDGYLALALRGGRETRILSRNQKDLGKKFTNIKDSFLRSMFRTRSLTAKLSRWTAKAVRLFSCCKGNDMGLVRPPKVFYAFDLLRLNGEDLRGLPIEERKAKLAALLKTRRLRSGIRLLLLRILTSF